MPRLQLGIDVFKAGMDRLESIYKRGHRVVVSFSGGKDSTVSLELAIRAAKKVGRLPVEVVIQDEEVSFPGTYEFVQRTAERREVSMTWLVMQQPMLNIFNRENPYFWVCDPLLPPSKWMREPPKASYVHWVEDKAIELMINPLRFPVEHTPDEAGWDFDEKRQCLVNVVGLRAQESNKRLLGIHSAGSYMLGSSNLGVFGCRPIYDWRDGDVWKFIKETGCDYNKAYDILYKLGGKQIRIGPPTMTVWALKQLQIAARAWPQWFDRLCHRLPGVRTAVQFGSRAVLPYRRHGETWEQCFYREVLGENVPQWIRDRARVVMEKKLSSHSAHSTAPFPETSGCKSCGVIATWRQLAEALWGGDPYCQKTPQLLPLIEPKFFREGAGTWAGSWEAKVGKKVRVMY